MLRSMKELEGYDIGATDGDIGKLKDFYFDDASWVVRYLIVDTGSWLSSRKVLISPFSIDQTDGSYKKLWVKITKEQVKDSPDIDTDKPVSRQHEETYLKYYGYPLYWTGTGLWGDGIDPRMAVRGFPVAGPSPEVQAEMHRVLAEADAAGHRDDDPHLRSCTAMVGYKVHANDGEIGHVEGALIDDETWSLRYLIVNTSNWWLGHSVLIAPQWITGMSWTGATVSVDLSREAIKHAPPYDPSKALLRQQEVDIYKYHGRSGYWPMP
ncbi:PRC-barrel domain containing protein [Sinimarinibacterium sp. CAU 1509]|uniref:PRC-barrel domain-containing protein n=1 Tax=Sinimarinibacterium sp. CAU 1509 TaxID=2562283 RepID=UPI0010ACA109|nr:PRC-barrel domain-containing protein [Sinimarinibacterium sp. CAU 1509]TJY55950.1 PRC-barrel domain containing protein [Sinimarinibacterium sp. CAU 1509]